MMFKYVKELGTKSDNYLVLNNVYTGRYDTGKGDYVVLDNFPGTVFSAGRFIELAEGPTVSEGSGGMKYDAGKPRMELLVQGCPNALEQVGTVLTFGAKKYAAHSWQTVPGGDDRYLAALLRHLTAIGKGEQTDPESGLSHLAHVACNALFILELECRKGKV